MGRVERGREIARRRVRKAKLTKLKQKFAGTKDQGTRETILAKVRRISPFMDPEQFAKNAAETVPAKAAK